MDNCIQLQQIVPVLALVHNTAGWQIDATIQCISLNICSSLRKPVRTRIHTLGKSSQHACNHMIGMTLSKYCLWTRVMCHVHKPSKQHIHIRILLSNFTATTNK